MVNHLPYIVDLDAEDLDFPTLQEWVEAHALIMDSLVLEGSEIMLIDDKIEAITLLEFWFDNDVAALVDLTREGLHEALTNNMHHWVDREDYTRAAKSRDLLSKLTKK
jgi:hypothetical protein